MGQRANLEVVLVMITGPKDLLLLLLERSSTSGGKKNDFTGS